MENGRFLTTHWTLVRSAGQDDTLARRSLESLCQDYWYPLYVYARRKGYDRDQAEDLTQSFFSQLIEKNSIQKAQQDKGRFRSFLLKTFQNFLFNEWDKTQTQKRGGGKKILSIDVEHAEERYKIEPQDHLTAEAHFERRWAMNVLELAMGQLKAEMEAKDKVEIFEHLKSFLNGGTLGIGYRETALKLNMTEAALKTTASRLRKRYRTLIRTQIAETLDGEDPEDEYQVLLKAITGT